jgi:plasmid stabilization system protein ParE
MSRPSIAASARAEIREIVEYVSADSPTAALPVRGAIFRAIGRIGEWPGMGHVRQDITEKPLRFLSVMGRYTIVYQEVGDRVIILHVFGAGRDIAKLLS